MQRPKSGASRRHRRALLPGCRPETGQPPSPPQTPWLELSVFAAPDSGAEGVNRVARKATLAEMPPAKVEPWTLELSAYGFGGTASGMLRSTSLDRSHYQIPGAMGCYRQESV